MGKTLTVILGAGASHGLNQYGVHSRDRSDHRPPLTSNIFDSSETYQGILQRYPLAEILASQLGVQLRRTSGAGGLEQILKSYSERAIEGPETPLARQFLQVPLYIADLFREVSQRFTSQPDEYNNLVNAIIHATEVDAVLFLTTNYDTLLEMPLSKMYGVNFSDESHYIRDPRWSLVKIHGSVNWYRAVRQHDAD